MRSASAGLLEEVALHYARIQWEYRLVGKGGAPGPVVKAGWDLATNQKI